MANQLLGYGNKTHNDTRSLWLQIERIKRVQQHSIILAFKLLRAQRKQDRQNGRSIVHLADFDCQLKAAEASIEKHCDGHKNALLALSVKQVHAGKLTINRLAALRVPPLKYVTDKELYVRELDEACTSYYKEFLEHSGPKATRQ